MAEQRQVDKLQLIYNSSVPKQGIALKTSRERWTIETGGERGSGRSVLAMRVGIGLHVNIDKTEFICFNQRGNISTLNGGSLKLVDKFTYFGSSVSTENDINT